MRMMEKIIHLICTHYPREVSHAPCQSLLTTCYIEYAAGKCQPLCRSDRDRGMWRSVCSSSQKYSPPLQFLLHYNLYILWNNLDTSFNPNMNPNSIHFTATSPVCLLGYVSILWGKPAPTLWCRASPSHAIDSPKLPNLCLHSSVILAVCWGFVVLLKAEPLPQAYKEGRLALYLISAIISSILTCFSNVPANENHPKHCNVCQKSKVKEFPLKGAINFNVQLS